MPKLVWYRSLYWRIALGFVALVATLLAAQGVVFLWLTGRMSEFLPGRSPQEYSQTIANDVAGVVADKPDADLDEYLNAKYTGTYRSFVVYTRYMEQVSSQRILPPPGMVNAARQELFKRLNLPSPSLNPRAESGSGGNGAATDPGAASTVRPNTGTPPRTSSPSTGFGATGNGSNFGNSGGNGPAGQATSPDRRSDGRPRTGRGGNDGWTGGGGRGNGRGRPGPGGPGGGSSGQMTFVYAPIIVNDDVFGMVAVPSEAPPLIAAIRNLGPTLGYIAISLLVVGTSLAALLIYWPTRRRLRSLQTAAQSIGAGESGARAIESGRDEVAMLAHAFNEMAAGLEERTEAVVTANESRRQLLADVSHELMTPLSAIRGYVETMTMADVKLDETTRQRYLGIVFDETERLEHIIGDLLDLARMEGGGGTWKSEPVSVSALFERVRHRHDPLLQSRHVTLETCVAPDAAELTGDPNRLEQALQNLAANAVRHTPEGGRVRLTADRIASGFRLVVEDTGPGIPEEHLPRVFDRFYKVDESRTGTKVPSGSGLGLSIVQAIVHRHGGRITAANGASGGARFEIVLPE